MDEKLNEFSFSLSLMIIIISVASVSMRTSRARLKNEKRNKFLDSKLMFLERLKSQQAKSFYNESFILEIKWNIPHPTLSSSTSTDDNPVLLCGNNHYLSNIERHDIIPLQHPWIFILFPMNCSPIKFSFFNEATERQQTPYQKGKSLKLSCCISTSFGNSFQMTSLADMLCEI